MDLSASASAVVDRLERRLPESVTLYCAAYSKAGISQSENWLSVSEKRRMASFGSRKRQREFLLGRFAARRLLAGHLDVPENAVEILVGAEGAPRIPYEGLRLSIAHARDLACAAINRGEIGIDIEPIVDRRPDLYTYLLHEREYPVLEDTGLPHNEAQILLWSLKEAVLKGRRTGFQMSPKRLTVSMDADNEAALVRLEHGEVWHVDYVRVLDHFLSAAIPYFSFAI